MRLIRLCFVLSFAVLALAGCRGTDPLDAGQSSEQNTTVVQSGRQVVPFQVVIDNTFEIVDPPPPPFLYGIFRGTAQCAPFGPAEFFGTTEVNVVVVPNEQTVDGVFTYPDGSELHFSTVGFGYPDRPENNIDGEFTITGGTARFTNATGSGTYVGTVFFDTQSAHWTMDGVISGFGGDPSE